MLIFLVFFLNAVFPILDQFLSSPLAEYIVEMFMSGAATEVAMVHSYISAAIPYIQIATNALLVFFAARRGLSVLRICLLVAIGACTIAFIC